MGILQLYSKEEFYTSTDPQKFQPGQLCWLPVPHPNPVPMILDVERSSPTEHEEVKFFLRNANRREDFRTRDRVLPLKSLNLRSHEELLVQRAKKRPGIIVSPQLDLYDDIARLLPRKGKKHLQQDSLFVIPMYAIETRDKPTGFPPEMVSRIQCLLYRQFFYLPGNSEVKEGIARFDRIQVVIGRDHAAISPTNVCLWGEPFNLFVAMLIYSISGIEDEDLEAARAVVKEAYPTMI